MRRLPSPRGRSASKFASPARQGNPPVPWIVSNPIYFLPPRVDAQSPPLAGDIAPLALNDWRIEKDPASGAILRTGSGRTRARVFACPRKPKKSVRGDRRRRSLRTAQRRSEPSCPPTGQGASRFSFATPPGTDGDGPNTSIPAAD